jgi:hypothetical protein
MALIVHPSAGAESYVSLADAGTYHTRFGNASWAAATEANREIALRRATQFIDTNYRFKSYAIDEEQPLEWPRYDFGTALPQRLTDAVCEAALIFLTDNLNSPITATGSVKSEKVGPIEVEYNTPPVLRTRYPILDRLLSPLALGKYGSTPLVRG